MLAIVLANKLARIAWSFLAHGRNFEVRKIDEFARSVCAGSVGGADQAQELGTPRAQTLDRGGQEAAAPQCGFPPRSARGQDEMEVRSSRRLRILLTQLARLRPVA